MPLEVIMNARDILLVKYSKKIEKQHGFIAGTQTSTEAGRESPDSDKTRRINLGTSTNTDTNSEVTDSDKTITAGTQTHTFTQREATDSDKK
jgi:hypothetical protein